MGAIGLDRAANGTHSLRRSKTTLIYWRTKNLRAAHLLLGRTKLESTVTYLGIEVDDALKIAEQTEVKLCCAGSSRLTRRSLPGQLQKAGVAAEFKHHCPGRADRAPLSLNRSAYRCSGRHDLALGMPFRVGMDLMEINARERCQPYDRPSHSNNIMFAAPIGILSPALAFPAPGIAFFDPGWPAVSVGMS